LNLLCQGLKDFFSHTERAMRIMAGLLKRRLPASGVMGVLANDSSGQDR
jgi:sulfatase maturation enzyme AslB (radical SAM superfamily)